MTDDAEDAAAPVEDTATNDLPTVDEVLEEHARRQVDDLDPDAPGRSLFADGDAVEPNEPG